MHLFGRCIIWHTSVTKKPQGSRCLIHMSTVRPADWEFSSAFQIFLHSVFKGSGSAERGEEESGLTGRGGMWLERQQVVCPQALMLQEGLP